MGPRVYSIELADFEQVWRGLSNITLDPVKNTLFYFIPFLGAMSSSYMPIRSKDYAQRGMIPSAVGDKLLQEVETLRKCAHLRRNLSLYTALNFHYTSYGGALSLSEPVVVIPYQHVLRPQASPFGFEKPEDNLAENRLAYTDNETRFFLAREIGHLKFNDAFMKTCAKILLIAAVCFLYSSVSWALTGAVAAAALTTYVIADRRYEAKMDLYATQLVSTTLGDAQAAHNAALTALKKMQAQNLERRERNFFCRLYITRSGNNLTDLLHPFLTTRIRNLQKQSFLLPQTA